MEKEAILAKLKAIIERYTPDKAALDQVQGTTNLLTDLKINSAHIVDIILDLEDEFDIEISDEEAEKMVTVDAAIEVVQAQLES